MKNEAEANAESDKAKRDEIDTRNSAEQLVYQTETQLKDLDETLSNDHKKTINSKKEELASLVKEGDIENIKSKVDELNKLWADIYQDISAQQQKTQTESNENNTSNQKDDNVEDADFEVVDDESKK